MKLLSAQAAPPGGVIGQFSNAKFNETNRFCPVDNHPADRNSGVFDSESDTSACAGEVAINHIETLIYAGTVGMLLVAPRQPGERRSADPQL